MKTNSTNSMDSGAAPEDVPDDAGQMDSDDAAGDAVSGMTNDSDGAPAPAGSIPPGPADPDDADLDATTLPPLSERMY